MRLSKPNEFYQALAEIEVALKLKLAGFDVLFVNPTPQYRTPDILVKHDSFAFNLEVTTLNSPEENTRLNDLHYKILDILLENRGTINLGGMIGRPPKIGESDKFLQLLRSKVKESREKKQVEIANVPGLATIYVVPQHLQDGMPEDTWTQFQFSPKRPRPVIDRIIDKLHNKAAQVSYQDRPGILVLYSGTSYWDPKAIFMDPESRLDVVQNTYRNLMGIVLSYRQLWKIYGSASVTKTLENKTLIELAPAVQEQEATIIWKNTHSKKCLPPEIVQAFINYQQNLTNLVLFPDNGSTLFRALSFNN